MAKQLPLNVRQLPRGISYQLLAGNPVPHRFIVRDPGTGQRLTKCWGDPKSGIAWADATLAGLKARTLPGRRVPWSEAATAYINELKSTNRRPSYITGVQRVSDGLVAAGATDLTSERFPELVRTYIATLRTGKKSRKPGREAAAGSKARQLAIIRAITHAAQKRHRIPFDPVGGVKAPKVRKTMAETMTLDELRLCLADEQEADPYYLRFALLAYLGCRQGEGLHLRWSDYDVGRQAIAIRDQPKFYDLKSGERWVPVPPELSALLIRQRRAGNYILSDCIRLDRHGKPVLDRTDYGRFKTYIAKCIGEDRAAVINRHSLRHLYARLMAATGVSLPSLKARLGHTAINTTMIYATGTESYESLVAEWKKGELRFRSDLGNQNREQHFTFHGIR